MYGSDDKAKNGSGEKELRKRHGQPDPEAGPMEDQGTDQKAPDWAKLGFTSEEKSSGKRKAKEEPSKERKKSKK